MSIKHLIEIILLAALWGASFLFMRVATPEFGPIALIEVRVLLAGLVLLIFWLAREPAAQRVIVKREWWALTVVGVLNSAVPFVLFAYATLYITGGYAAILNATAPIWGAVVAWLWLRQPLAISRVLGLIIGFSGVMLLVSGSIEMSLQAKSLAVLAAFSAPILYGIAANYTSEKLAHVSALGIATFSQLSSAILLMPLALWFMPTQPISVNAWLSATVLAVLCTSVAYILYFRLIAQVGSTKAITVTFLIPVFGMFWGALFLNEEVTRSMLIGSGIILLGTALATGLIKFESKTP